MNLAKLKKTLRQKDARASFTRKAFAVCTLSLACGPVFAQAGFDFGLKGIFQASSLISSTDQAAGPELDYKIKTGVAGGVSAGYNFNKHVGLELNILSSGQGQGYVGDASKINGNSRSILSYEFDTLANLNKKPLSGNYTAQVFLNYIKIPILFRYTGNNTKKVFFSSFIGPQFDLLSSAKIQVNGSDAKFTNVATSSMYKKTTVDVAFGFGAGCNISKNLVLSLHLRLDYGLGDAEDKGALFAGSAYKIYGDGRSSNHNATGGGLISLNYKLLKKEKPAPKAKAMPAKPKK